MDTSPNNIPHRVALICALEYEIAPLIRGWRRTSLEADGRRLMIFENEDAIVAVSGIGSNFARSVSRAVVEEFSPCILISSGLAGSITDELRAGQAFLAKEVINATTGRKWSTSDGQISLVTTNEIVGWRQKQQLASAYQAQAVDMEAAGVAEVAAGYGIPFLAAKAISDPLNFQMPAIQPFIRADGGLSTFRFMLFIAVRPWLWASAIILARNSARAVTALEHLLRQLIRRESERAKAVKLEQGIRSS
jgi:adenosylhomocysteine nucleosidase